MWLCIFTHYLSIQNYIFKGMFIFFYVRIQIYTFMKLITKSIWYFWIILVSKGYRETLVPLMIWGIISLQMHLKIEAITFSIFCQIANKWAEWRITDESVQTERLEYPQPQQVSELSCSRHPKSCTVQGSTLSSDLAPAPSPGGHRSLRPHSGRQSPGSGSSILLEYLWEKPAMPSS